MNRAGKRLRVLAASVMSLCTGTIAHAEAQLNRTGAEIYFSDSVNCDADDRTAVLSGDWAGHTWSFIVPDTIQSSASPHRRGVEPVNLRPLEALRSSIAKLGSFTQTALRSSIQDSTALDGNLRLRLVSVEAKKVTQEFSGSDYFVSVVVRLCRRRNTAWESVRYESTRAVRGKMEFWRFDTRAEMERYFARAFQVAMDSTLSWASASADANWSSGEMLNDPVYGR